MKKLIFFLLLIVIFVNCVNAQKQNLVLYNYNAVNTSTTIRDRVYSATLNAFGLCNNKYKLLFRLDWKNTPSGVTDIITLENEISEILYKIAYKVATEKDKEKINTVKNSLKTDLVVIGKIRKNKDFEDEYNAYEINIQIVKLSDLSLEYPATIYLTNSEIDDTKIIQLKIMRYLKGNQIGDAITDIELNKIQNEINNRELQRSLLDYKALMDTLVMIEFDYPNINEPDIKEVIDVVKGDLFLKTIYLNQRVSFYNQKVIKISNVDNPDLVTAQNAINLLTECKSSTTTLYKILKTDAKTKPEKLKSLLENSRTYDAKIQTFQSLFPQKLFIPKPKLD